jgi:hypothetical protein
VLDATTVRGIGNRPEKAGDKRGEDAAANLDHQPLRGK